MDAHRRRLLRTRIFVLAFVAILAFNYGLVALASSLPKPESGTADMSPVLTFGIILPVISGILAFGISKEYPKRKNSAILYTNIRKDSPPWIERNRARG